MSFSLPPVASEEGPMAPSEATKADVRAVTVTVSVAECESDPLVPVTVTV